MNLYIYYKVRKEQSEELRARVCSMQQALSKRHGVVTSLQRRPEEKEGRQTWMETYASTPEGFGEILAEAVADAGLMSLIEGDRHAEYFVSVSCA